MLKLRQGIQIYVSLSSIDMRKAMDSLSAIVLQEFNQDPQCGHLFVFFNRSRDKAKILYWDRNGFDLHYKRMEKIDLLFLELNIRTRLLSLKHS